MSRKKGFSLVELLIVLAVMAALIATITPVALNAIKKSKATQVAQNLKTLASAIENAAYVNGIDTNKKIKNASDGTEIKIKDLARDLPKDSSDKDLYGFAYTESSGKYNVVVFYGGLDANTSTVKEVLNATNVGYTSTDLDASDLANLAHDGKDYSNTTGYIYYYFDFTVY